MNSKINLCLALCLCGILTGCSAIKPPVIPGNGSDGELIKLPIKFADYREFYTFVAQRTYGGMPTDAENLFKLAAESRTEIISLDYKAMPYVYVVEPHYFIGENDEIRGAQGNGDYYILCPLAAGHTPLGGFELVGVAEGNGYTLRYSNGVPQFVTYWHMSASDHVKNIYDWNGKEFQQIK